MTMLSLLVCVCFAVPQESKPAFTLSANKLWNEFGENELAADGKYTGKIVEIIGTADRVQKGDDGKYYLGIATILGAVLTQAQYNMLNEKEKKWYDDGYPPNIVCRIHPDHLKAFADVKKDKPVKVIGKVIGRKKADVYEGYIVELSDCRLVK